MASTKAQLRALVRLFINNTDTTSNDAFSDSQVNISLLAAAREVQTFLERADAGIRRGTATAALLGSETSLTLPADFRQLIDLRRTDGGQNAKFYSIESRNIKDTDANTFVNNDNRYTFYLSDTTIVFPVVMGEAWTYTLHYTKDITDPTTDNDTYGFPTFTDNLMAYTAASLLLGGEGSKNWEYWERKISKEQTMVMSAVSRRNNSGPRYVSSPYQGTQ